MEAKTMRKAKKNRKQELRTKQILLLTAITNLIAALVNLIAKLTE